MIGYLRGAVLRLAPDEVLLDVGGVGYRVHVPLSTYYALEAKAADAAVGLFVHTHVREDSLALFGFETEGDLQLFERLIGVSGIGPKLGQAILSGLPAPDLAAAISQGDLRRLVAIPGVGKKTAERLVLELRDKVGDIAVGPATTAASAALRPKDDVVAALVNLGYKPAAAERAVQAVLGDGEERPVSDLLRAALRQLAPG